MCGVLLFFYYVQTLCGWDNIISFNKLWIEGPDSGPKAHRKLKFNNLKNVVIKVIRIEQFLKESTKGH